MVLIKAYLGNDARRITVEDDIPFADLRAMLMKLFAVSGSGEPIIPPAPTQFWIRYKDDEDDLVSISTDSDLREAIAYSASHAGLLRLYIQQGDGDDGKVEADTGSSAKRPATSVGVHAIPHHTLQHRNNLVLQSLAQPEFAVQISKMVSQVVTTQNPAFTDLIQQMVQALAPQMESLLLPTVSAVLQQQTATLVQQQQQQQQQLQQQQQAAFYARQQSPPQAPNTYPIYSHPPPAQSPYSPPPTPASLPIPYSPAPSSGLAEPLMPTAPTSTEKKKESTTPSGISAMRNMLPSIFKVGIPTTSPGPSPPTSDKDGRMSSSPPQSYPPPQQQDRRKRSSSSIHEADFSWVDSEGSGSGGNIPVGGGLGGSGNGRRDPSPRHRSVSNPVPIAASPPSTSSSTDLSQMSPSSFSPSPLAAMTPASPASRARAAPPALPPPGVTFTEEQYQQLYREWEPVLAQLKQMGFEDPRRNIDLILAYRGSMVDVVEQLLNRKS